MALVSNVCVKPHFNTQVHPPPQKKNSDVINGCPPSAFQMPDNVFGDRRVGGQVPLPANLASDIISLEALSPRPRSRSRSRGHSKAATNGQHGGREAVIAGRRSSSSR